MTWTNGVFTLPGAATSAFPGKVLASADWNSVFGQVIDGAQQVGQSIYNVKFYGAVGDGVTDDATAIQAAITACIAGGGGIVYFPPGTYAIGTTIVIRASGVMLQGAGTGARFGNSLNYVSALLWIGGASTMLDYSPISGAGNPPLYGGGVQFLALRGAGTAVFGLTLKSVRRSNIDVQIEACTNSAMYMGVVGALSDFRDCQLNTIRLNAMQHNSAAYGKCLVLDGDATANTSFNTFTEVVCTYLNSIAIDIINGDNNFFLVTQGVRGGGGTATDSIALRAAATDIGARSNFFYLCSFSQRLLSEGTTVAAVAAHDNFVLLYDTGNSMPDPSIGTGSTLTWWNSESKIKWGGPLSPSVTDGAALGTTGLQWSDLFLAEGGVINWDNGDVSITQTGNVLSFAGATTRYEFDGALTPTASDGATLGTTGLQWSDLFLASGAVINFNNGNYTLTHSAGQLLASGIFAVNDANFNLQISGGNSAITFDSGDFIQYDRTNNNWQFNVGSALKFGITSTDIRPGANDSASLGVSGTAWSDLFLASGAVINFNAGQLTLTQSGTTLDLVGTLQVDALRIDQAPTAVGTGAKTISNAADSSTNLGHYLSVNMNGTTYFIPCGTVALT